MPGVLRERRRVRDGVIEQHTERREADSTPEVRRHDEERDDAGNRELRTRGNVLPLLDGRKTARKIAVARHSERGAADAGDQRKEGAEARDRRTDTHDRHRPRGARRTHRRIHRRVTPGEHRRPAGRERRNTDYQIEHDGDAEREWNGARNRPLRIAHLLAERGDARIPGEREEEEARSLEHAVHAAVREHAADVRRRSAITEGDRSDDARLPQSDPGTTYDPNVIAIAAHDAVLPITNPHPATNPHHSPRRSRP